MAPSRTPQYARHHPAAEHLVASATGHSPSANDKEYQKAQPNQQQQVAVVARLVKRNRLYSGLAPLTSELRVNVVSRECDPKVLAHSPGLLGLRGFTILGFYFGRFSRGLQQRRLDKLAIGDRPVNID